MELGEQDIVPSSASFEERNATVFKTEVPILDFEWNKTILKIFLSCKKYQVFNSMFPSSKLSSLDSESETA